LRGEKKIPHDGGKYYISGNKEVTKFCCVGCKGNKACIFFCVVVEKKTIGGRSPQISNGGCDGRSHYEDVKLAL